MYLHSQWLKVCEIWVGDAVVHFFPALVTYRRRINPLSLSSLSSDAFTLKTQLVRVPLC